ncbi:ankyrin-1-like [Trichogramma pretiosum]|uniref:ankyrin-1-like n=1 Tax=Trichogramma pretiosum TaxID=7493 RepID=UPI0006C951FA|nr:ankyrin-1-like [Trichogramma pretiosum]
MYSWCELTKLARSIADWSRVEERIAFLHQLDSFISHWEGPLNNLLNVFSHEQVECLLFDSINCVRGESDGDLPERFIEFVARSGFKAGPPELDADGKPELFRDTPILLAAKKDQRRCVELLFEIYDDRFDANYLDVETGYTHFHVACSLGYVDVVEKFLELGEVDVDLRVGMTNDTPLHLAALHEHRSSMELLLRHGANPNSTNFSKMTPLHIVCKKRDEDGELLRLIFDICEENRRPLEIDARDEDGHTALHLALRHNGNLTNAIQLLLRNGADPNAANEDGLTVFHLVCQMDRDGSLAEMFLEMSRELGKPVDIDARDVEGDSPLHVALKFESKRLVELLLRRGVDPNLPNWEGETPLHVICENDEGDEDGLARLFFAVCDEIGRAVHIDAGTAWGNTPLHVALAQGQPELIERLMRRGADSTKANDEGVTPLHLVCKRDWSVEINWLETFFGINDELGRTLSINARNRRGLTPLHLATMWGTEAIIRALLRRGADPRVADEKGETPLHIVCQKRSSDLATALLDESRLEYRPVPLDARDEWLGQTPLHHALIHDNRDAAVWLLRRGCDPNCVDNDGSSPLHIVCRRKDDDGLAETFFEIVDENNQWVQVDVRDERGRTPLQCAVANLLPNAVDALLTHGADLTSFSFPARISFFWGFDDERSDWAKLKLAARAMACCELLEARGYETDRADDLKVMRFFDEHELFLHHGEGWHDDEFTVDAKKITIKPGLSLHDLIELPARETARRVTCHQFFKFLRKPENALVLARYCEDCLRHLREKISSSFFRYWALEPLMELTHCRLPILCCKMITENLSNEDLYNICLAAEGQSSRCQRA